MAFWTDGAAYAPLERPDGFATPETAPLPVAEPAPQPTPGAVEPPSGFAPMPPSVALENLGRKEISRRNPTVPFNVSSALMMAYTGYGARDPKQPFAVSAISSPHASMAPPDPAARLAPPPNPYQPMYTVPYPSAPQYGQTASAPMTQAQRSLLIIAGAASLMGAFLPTALPLLLMAGGGLLLRAGATGRQIGIASFVVGALLTLTMLARMQYVLNGLGRWIGLAFGIACVATAFSQARR